ncbi:hypothetical protein P9112_004949 [Eukaryota sp. TZLM1-RC]
MPFTLVELLYTYDVLSSFNEGPIGKEVPRSLLSQTLSTSSVPSSTLKTCISSLSLNLANITFSDVVILFRAISLLQTSPQSIPTRSQIDSLPLYTPPTFSSISVSTPPSHDIPSTSIYPTPDAVVFAASSFDKLGIQGPASRQSVLPLLEMFRSRVSGDKIKKCWDHFSKGQEISKVSFVGFFCFLGKIAKGEVSGIDEVTEAFNPNPNPNPRSNPNPQVNTDLDLVMKTSDQSSLTKDTTEVYKAKESISPKPKETAQKQSKIQPNSTEVVKSPPVESKPVELPRKYSIQELSTEVPPLPNIKSVSQNSNEYIRLLESRISNYEKHYSSLVNDYEESRTILQEERSRFDSQWETLIKLEKENEILTEKIAIIRVNSAEVKAKIRMVETQNEELSVKNSELSRRKVDLEQELQRSLVLLEQIKKTESTLKSDNIEQETTINSLLSEISAVNSNLEQSVSFLQGFKLPSLDTTVKRMMSVFAESERVLESMSMFKSRVAGFSLDVEHEKIENVSRLSKQINVDEMESMVQRKITESHKGRPVVLKSEQRANVQDTKEVSLGRKESASQDVQEYKEQCGKEVKKTEESQEFSDGSFNFEQADQKEVKKTEESQEFSDGSFNFEQADQKEVKKTEESQEFSDGSFNFEQADQKEVKKTEESQEFSVGSFNFEQADQKEVKKTEESQEFSDGSFNFEQADQKEVKKNEESQEFSDGSFNFEQADQKEVKKTDESQEFSDGSFNFGQSDDLFSTANVDEFDFESGFFDDKVKSDQPTSTKHLDDSKESERPQSAPSFFDQSAVDQSHSNLQGAEFEDLFASFNSAFSPLSVDDVGKNEEEDDSFASEFASAFM